MEADPEGPPLETGTGTAMNGSNGSESTALVTPESKHMAGDDDPLASVGEVLSFAYTWKIRLQIFVGFLFAVVSGSVFPGMYCPTTFQSLFESNQIQSNPINSISSFDGNERCSPICGLSSNLFSLSTSTITTTATITTATTYSTAMAFFFSGAFQTLSSATSTLVFLWW